MLIISMLFSLFLFYCCGGFRWLLKCCVLDTEEEPQRQPIEYRAEKLEEPEEVQTPTETVRIEPPTETTPPQIKPYTPPINKERERLERIAAGLLVSQDENITYNVFYKVHYSSDEELKIIIADYYINK